MKMKGKPQAKQYVIYSRKSKFTGKGESIENQIELCRQYIAMHFGEEAAENVLVYEDEGFSGGNLERPQFKKMMKDSQKIAFAAIVVYRLDRISRNIGDFAKLIEDLGDRHIDFISIREQFDTSSPMGRAMMYIASVFSQLERETIAERIRDNMHELSKTGRWLGGTTPTGYASESLSSVTVDGKPVAAGNARLMAKLGLTVPDVPQTGTIVHVAIDGKYAGYLLISDVVKPHSAQAIKGLKQAGVRKTVMLTGDAEPVAKAVSAELGIDEYHAGLLPGDKVDQIEKLLAAKKPKEMLAFVGDGINDAPVLSRVDVGIAMGALGSDAAIEAADVVLMDDDPAKIALAMRIARRTKSIVYQNIVFALAIKAACLLLGALGIANMWAAIFADVGVMVLAVLNATRMLNVKEYQ